MSGWTEVIIFVRRQKSCLTKNLHREKFHPLSNFGRLQKTNIEFFNWKLFWLNFNPLSANPTKWFPRNCLSVFDHFVGLALKGLNMFLASHFKCVSNPNNDTIESKVNLLYNSGKTGCLAVVATVTSLIKAAI